MAFRIGDHIMFWSLLMCAPYEDDKATRGTVPFCFDDGSMAVAVEGFGPMLCAVDTHRIKLADEGEEPQT